MSQGSEHSVEVMRTVSSEVPNSRSSKGQKHVKRPMNAFMVWAHERRRKMSTVSPTMHHSNISKILGAEWKMLSDQEKHPYVEKAKAIHEQHMTDNPDYKYRPQRKVRNQQKRPRLLPPPITSVPTRIFPLSVADNTPFEMPIVGVTSVQAYSMEEFNYRQNANALPHLTQKASNFTRVIPGLGKKSSRGHGVPTTASEPISVVHSLLKPPTVAKAGSFPPGASSVTVPPATTRTLSAVQGASFSLKPMIAGVKFLPVVSTGPVAKLPLPPRTQSPAAAKVDTVTPLSEAAVTLLEAAVTPSPVVVSTVSPSPLITASALLNPPKPTGVGALPPVAVAPRTSLLASLRTTIVPSVMTIKREASPEIASPALEKD